MTGKRALHPADLAALEEIKQAAREAAREAVREALAPSGLTPAMPQKPKGRR